MLLVRQDIAFLIKQYDAKTKIGELESQNKLQVTMSEDRIKIADVCFKIDCDRLGDINILTKEKIKKCLMNIGNIAIDTNVLYAFDNKDTKKQDKAIEILLKRPFVTQLVLLNL
jgi:hypothetical protein